MSSHPRLDRACTWGGPAGLILTFGGMLIAGWLPPPSPGDSAVEVGRYYGEHTDAIRVASVLIMVGGVLFLPLTAVTSSYLQRIEGGRGPMSLLQLISGVLGPVAFILPSFLWAAAAFDPERSVQITKALHDAGWIVFIAGIWTFVLQNMAIGTAVLLDGREDPVLPRWLGYTACWTALLFVPSFLVIFFHDGPFSWNGVFTFWLAAAAFVVWIVVLVTKLQTAITRFAADDGPGDAR